MKSYKAKSAIFGHFGAFLTPFGALGAQLEFSPKKSFGKSLTLIGITLCKKSEKSNGWFSRKSRTNGRTDERTNGRTGLIP